MEEIVELKVKLDNIQLPPTSGQQQQQQLSLSRQMSLKRHNSNKLTSANKFAHRLLLAEDNNCPGSNSSAGSEIPCNQDGGGGSGGGEKREENPAASNASVEHRSPVDNGLVESSPFKIPSNYPINRADRSPLPNATTLQRAVTVSRGGRRETMLDVIVCETDDDAASVANHDHRKSAAKDKVSNQKF